MSTTIRIKRIILCMSLMCVHVHISIYTRDINEAHIYICMYSRGPSSRRKSRCEIIMQKMHREDYDLICRARKQFVSLKEGILVNLRNYRTNLPAVSMFSVLSSEARMKWRKERDAYVFTRCEERIYISGWSNSDWKLHEYESSVI